MARIRSVKPELCTSETMAEVSAVAERTFVRLWTHCDDEGRCKDNPKLLKAALFPLHDDVTPADLDAHLWELSDRGLIVRYSVAGDPYLHVPSWREHQKPQKRQPSKLPAPDSADEQAIQHQSRTTTRPLPEGSGPVVEGRVEGEVVGAVEGDPASCTSPQLSVVAEPLDDAAVEIEVRKAIGRAARTIAATDPTIQNPGAAQAAIGQRLRDQFHDEITERVRNGEPTDDVAAWLADPLAGFLEGLPDRPTDARPPLRPVADPVPCDDCLGSGYVVPFGESVARRCVCNPHPAPVAEGAQP